MARHTQLLMQLRFFSRSWILLILTGLILFTTQMASADDFNFLTFGGEGELYVPIPLENSLLDGDRLRVRSVELTSQADLKQWMPNLSGKLTLGAEDSSGDLTFNIREAYVVTSDILNSLDLRAGKFYLPVGILNQSRRSAWSMISAPRPLTLFFTDLGVVDSGVDLTFHSSAFAVRAGVTNGYRFDNSVNNGGARPETPTHFARPEFTFHLGESDLSIAGNYLARVDDQGRVLRISGLDLSLSPKTVDQNNWRGQMEFYHRYQNPQQGLAIVEDIGGYVLGEKGLAPKVTGGLRFDAYKIPSLTDQSGANRKNLTLAATPILTYRSSAHALLQASYTYLKETRDGNTDRAEQTVEFRFVAEFGDLPVSR
jgi:hypothetical protein